jgi:hypothetical protein
LASKWVTYKERTLASLNLACKRIKINLQAKRQTCKLETNLQVKDMLASQKTNLQAKYKLASKKTNLQILVQESCCGRPA